jgi:hypothetical protein
MSLDIPIMSKFSSREVQPVGQSGAENLVIRIEYPLTHSSDRI